METIWCGYPEQGRHRMELALQLITCRLSLPKLSVASTWWRAQGQEPLSQRRRNENNYTTMQYVGYLYDGWSIECFSQLLVVNDRSLHNGSKNHCFAAQTQHGCQSTGRSARNQWCCWCSSRETVPALPESKEMILTQHIYIYISIWEHFPVW